MCHSRTLSSGPSVCVLLRRPTKHESDSIWGSCRCSRQGATQAATARLSVEKSGRRIGGGANKAFEGSSAGRRLWRPPGSRARCCSFDRVCTRTYATADADAVAVAGPLVLINRPARASAAPGHARLSAVWPASCTCTSSRDGGDAVCACLHAAVRAQGHSAPDWP